MSRAGIICEKCGSREVYEERDRWGTYLTCLTCGWAGYTIEAPVKLGREPVMPGGKHLKELVE